jgi:hypothetical protein
MYFDRQPRGRRIIHESKEVLDENCVRGRIGIRWQSAGVRRRLGLAGRGIEVNPDVNTLRRGWIYAKRTGLPSDETSSRSKEKEENGHTISENHKSLSRFILNSLSRKNASPGASALRAAERPAAKRR